MLLLGPKLEGTEERREGKKKGREVEEMINKRNEGRADGGRIKGRQKRREEGERET